MNSAQLGLNISGLMRHGKPATLIGMGLPSMETDVSDNADAVTTLKGRIGDLRPIVDAHRQEMDRMRRLPTEVFDAIAEAGLLKLWLPRALGGWQLSPADFMEVVEAAATVDGSVGWIVGNGGGISRAGGYLEEAVARALFDPAAAFVVATNGAVGEAVPVEGGFRIRGRWPFASGIHHASTVAPACRVGSGDKQGTVLLCYVPARHAEVIDNWQVSGLRGSGSCDYELADVFVAREYTHDMLAPPARQPGVVYRWPAVSAFAMTVSVVPLGIARAALDTFEADLAARARAGTTAALRDRELIQSELGRAEALHAAARAYLRSATQELSEALEHGGDGLVRARAMYRTACSHAAESAIRIAEMVSAAAGAVSIWEAHPLERQVRDIQAAAKHVAMSPNNYVVAGRLCLGLDPGAARF
jgi:alkylation response protein AidB-like acyl-CoA dehydrogenase